METRSKKKADKGKRRQPEEGLDLSPEEPGKTRQVLSPLTTRKPSEGQIAALRVFRQAITNLAKRGELSEVNFSADKVVDEMNRIPSSWVFELPPEPAQRNKIRASFKLVGLYTWAMEDAGSLAAENDRLVEEKDRIVEEKDRMAVEIARLKDQLAKSTRLEQLGEDQEMPGSPSVPVVATPRHPCSHAAPVLSPPSATPSENAILMGLADAPVPVFEIIPAKAEQQKERIYVDAINNLGTNRLNSDEIAPATDRLAERLRLEKLEKIQKAMDKRLMGSDENVAPAKANIANGVQVSKDVPAEFHTTDELPVSLKQVFAPREGEESSV